MEREVSPHHLPEIQVAASSAKAFDPDTPFLVYEYWYRSGPSTWASLPRSCAHMADGAMCKA